MRNLKKNELHHDEYATNAIDYHENKMKHVKIAYMQGAIPTLLIIPRYVNSDHRRFLFVWQHCNGKKW